MLLMHKKTGMTTPKIMKRMAGDNERIINWR